MNREIDEIFKQWKQFLSWCYETNDKTTEIHRDNLEIVMAYSRQLESIIKEVREYIEEKYDYILGDDTFLDHDERIERKQIKHILDIL